MKKTIYLITGKQGIGKSTLIRKMKNAKEVEISHGSQGILTELLDYDNICICFQSKVSADSHEPRFKKIAESLGIKLKRINLT